VQPRRQTNSLPIERSLRVRHFCRTRVREVVGFFFAGAGDALDRWLWCGEGCGRIFGGGVRWGGGREGGHDSILTSAL
jgi:hypothetical protein